LRRVVSVADEVNVVAGDVLAKQGCAAEWFFLIHSGEAEVVRHDSRLEVLGPGEHFGEVALLGRGAQPATVRALTAMTLFVIGAQRFVPLVQDTHRLRRDMDAALSRQAELVKLARDERDHQLRPSRPTVSPSIRAGLPLTVFPMLGTVTVPSRMRPGRGPSARWRVGLASVVLAVLGPVTGIALLYHPPYAVIGPGPAIDLSSDIVISGVPVHPPRGRYLMITTKTLRPNLLGVGISWLQLDRKIIPVDRLGPPGSSEAEVQRRLAAQFAASQTEAAAAAARAAGMPVDANGRLPFTVHFRSRDVVGPSAGLIYALQIEDMLSASNRARGRIIAATGQIDPTGTVSAVGYLTEKAETARRAGTELLLVPKNEIGPALGSGLIVDGVGSLNEALTDLSAGSP
jgi:PDZ domain-containing protein